MISQGGFSFIQDYLPLGFYLRNLISPSLSNRSGEGDEDEEQMSTHGEQDKNIDDLYYKFNLTSVPIDLGCLKKLDAYAREVSFTSNLKSLVHVLLQEAHSDLEKVRAIWMWICHHIEYDVAKTVFKLADILRSRKGVCAGYAKLFHAMCSIAGIKCKILTGCVKVYFDTKKTNFKDRRHAWNAVYIDGKWYLLDCTWASGYVKNGKFTFKYSEFYFLTHPAIFINDHFPDESSWQLLKPALTEQDFGKNRTISPPFFLQMLVPAPTGTSGIETGHSEATASSEKKDRLRSGKIKKLFIRQLSHEKSGAQSYHIVFLNCSYLKDQKKLTVSEQESGQNRQLSPSFSQQQVEEPLETPVIKTAPAPKSFRDKLFAFFR